MIDTHELLKLYAVKGSSLRSCGKVFGVGKDAIKKILRDNNISIKSKSHIIAEKNIDSKWRNKELLTHAYVNEGRSCADIAGSWGCDKSVILDWLSRHNIETRSSSESHMGIAPSNKGLGKRNSAETVVCECGCGEVLLKYGHSSNSRRFLINHRLKGENHPMYKPLSPNRDRKHTGSDYRLWRIEVLKRDNYTCVCCCQVGGKLNAHHVLPVAKFVEFMHLVIAGKTLCLECHKEVHSVAREIMI